MRPLLTTRTFAQILQKGDQYTGWIYSQTGQYGEPDEHYKVQSEERDEVWDLLDNWIMHNEDLEVEWI